MFQINYEYMYKQETVCQYRQVLQYYHIPRCKDQPQKMFMKCKNIHLKAEYCRVLHNTVVSRSLLPIVEHICLLKC